MKLVVTFLGLLIVAVSCVGQTLSDSRKADVVELVYRTQIAQCYKDRSPKTYFLSYERHDPDDALLERFASYGPRVMKRSQMRQFKNSETGKWPIIISVTNVDFRSQHVAYVRGACTAAVLDGYSYLYRVEFRWGRWIVMRRRLLGVA
jgi:hypothetical protein